ncbi:hypothetical protein GCM10007907_24920 [Chitinimonas prasina]|uniref:Phage coat protein n=1 Tax=Chitinimonas prasina TaxID=1434937 RepID=A0ABQ5YGU0_9NEIS|nr:hypothetical protein [Chitinimonas prasina]GLR13702.1 hypothetical protein GCM10007907_24920 [Chitinimonas prasina]
MSNKQKLLSLFAAAAVLPAQAAVTMPTVDPTSDIGTVVTWGIALMGVIFGAYLAMPLAAKAFKAVQGFIGR